MIRTALVLGLVGLLGNALADTRSGEIDRLVEQLGHSRFAVREQAQRRLLELGRPAVPALREAAKSADLEIRTRARIILRTLQSSVEYLLDELKSGTPAARREAAESLGQLGKEARAAIPTLVGLLKEKDEGLREAAALALGAIDPENKALADLIPPQAHVNGKYRKLLKKARVDQDLQSYGRFSDYGYHPACDWGGHRNLPGGYWVYVYPNWYIWGEQKGVAAPGPIGPAPQLP